MYLRFSSSLIAAIAVARASNGGEPGSGRSARRARKENEMVGILAVDAVPLKTDRDPRALQAATAPTCMVNGVETAFVECDGCNGPAWKQKCEEACDGKENCSCCVGGKDNHGFFYEGCTGFQGKVCPDGSCSGAYACGFAEIGYVVDGCRGVFACQAAGRFGGDLGRVVSSCKDERACSFAAQQGGSIQEISSSCNKRKACFFAAAFGGSIQEISSSCNGEYACQQAARAGTIPNKMEHCCNTDSACLDLARDGDENPGPDQCGTEAPTMVPTRAPTKPPTQAPTSPTEAPVKAPTSKAPTPSPSTASPMTGSPTAAWCPDWGGLNDRCVAECAASRWTPTYADKRTCCEKHYSWRLDGCMGAANTPTGKYFPDWLGTGTCKLDEGDAPSYMVNNPTSWLKDTLAQCCQAHFDWIYQECAGGASAVAGMWYPDWAGGTNACLNDDQQPSYMTQNPEMFMNESRESCCLAWFSWAPDTCPGTP